MLKKLLWLSLAMVLGYSAEAQYITQYKEIYVGSGYGLGFGRFDAANGILNTFDANKDDQEKSFKNFNPLHGFSIVAGTTIYYLNIEVGFSQMQQIRRSTYNNDTNLFRREARLRNNTIHIGGGPFFTVSKNFGFGMNAQLDASQLMMSTREALDTEVSATPFISAPKKRSMGMTFDVRFYFGQMRHNGTKFMLKPFYSFVFDKLDVSQVDGIINGANADTSANRDLNFSNAGLKVIITYSIRR